MDTSEIRPLRADDVEPLLAVWERSVRATHSFLSEDDITFFKPFVRAALDGTSLEVWVLGEATGFVGMDGNKIEALFLDPDRRGKGSGRKLVDFVQRLHPGDLTLDVNEQNHGAVGFYQHLGFVVEGRSEVDGTGRPFPLLHMRRRGDSR